MTRPPKKTKAVKSLKHEGARRRNIPTAEMEPVVQPNVKEPIAVRYPRNTDIDPQLMWRGKDAADWSNLVVTAPPLYIQEKIHPKALVDDLLRQSKARADAEDTAGPDLFQHDFNGLLDVEAKTEFYGHDQNWTNRMILGDSLQVMASLATREDLASKVQCIYFDPPYGIKFSSNWQVSTRSRDVKDGKIDHISREPEMVRAFRDTWRDGIHSYLTYLRDRLTVARDLLTESGSIFVQIGDENVHRVRALMDEVFGPENFVAMIYFQTAANQNTKTIQRLYDIVLFYRKTSSLKYREILRPREANEEATVFDKVDEVNQKKYKAGQIKNISDKARFVKCGRLDESQKYFKRYMSDSPFVKLDNVWKGTIESTFSSDKIYVVQTTKLVIQRCILMATDPGDLVLDPTCGSGTTATVAEQWGRRWITIDTSRVALALARARIMGARYPYYLLEDSEAGRQKEAEVTGKPPAEEIKPTEDIRYGLVYQRFPKIKVSAIANNAEIDVIWGKWQEKLEPLRKGLNAAIDVEWEEWQVPREIDPSWPSVAKDVHPKYWAGRIARQQEIDASITKNADVEYLYDRPYEDTGKVRVAGPFTVESLSPHRTMAVDVDGELIDDIKAHEGNLAAPSHVSEEEEFAQVILNNLESAGVQQMYKDQRIRFTGGITAHPGKFLCAVGRYVDGDVDGDTGGDAGGDADTEDETAPQRRAGIFIGPEYGTVQRADLVAAGREAADMGFDVLIACAFNYDPQSTDTNNLGALPIIKARINPDLHMAGDLKNTGAGNLFVVFGEPDIETIIRKDGDIQIKIHGVDIFNTKERKVESADADQIAAWFIDSDYNEESFFVRHAYFLGGGTNDPYKQLKSSLKAEIDQEAWESLYSDISRPFARPNRGRIAVKVIDHLGNEVMKVFEV